MVPVGGCGVVYVSLAPIALFLDPEGCHSLTPWLLKIILSPFVSGSVPFSELAEMLADMVRAGAGILWARKLGQGRPHSSGVMFLH